MLDFNDIKKEYHAQLTMDKPIVFKKYNVQGESHSLVFYPVLMENYFEFSVASNILRLNKNKSGDFKTIKMSYMEFLCSLMEKELLLKQNERLCSSMLYMLFAMSTRNESIVVEFRKNDNDKYILIIDGFSISSDEFDKIKGIILMQNFPDYKEEFLNPELEKEIEEVRKVRMGRKKMKSLEEQMIATCINASISFDEIKKISIRKYSVLSEMSDSILQYKINKTASLSGNVEFKQEIVHYLMSAETNDFVDTEQFKHKIESVN